MAAVTGCGVSHVAVASAPVDGRNVDPKASTTAVPLPTIVFMGDSITYNWSQGWAGTTFTSHSNWIDVGISGQTSGQMQARFRGEVILKHPAVVVILAGTNDVYPSWQLCGGEWWIDTCHNIDDMVQQAKAAGIKPILATIPPWNCVDANNHCALAQNADSSPGRYAKIDALNEWIKEYGFQQGLVVVDYHSVLVAADGKMYPPALTIDGVHPMPAGYALMAPMIEDAIQASY
jgi:lysophospholipase L1-like esterase